ncbi:MAG: class I tRNA ligase family protein [Phycisphaerales bacterium]|nr:class I tRNA ligase family protein [Phycisphaerales bacterium]
MSKKLRNYKEPSYIFDTLGADAMRWYFLSAQAPWTSTRFAEAAIRDSQREFLVKLYNVLSFFTIYASIDGFDPRKVTLDVVKSADGFEVADKKTQGPVPMGWRPSAERTELDRWIITYLRSTVSAVRESMDRFENYPAAQKLNDFVDALSNWYVRRSRDRFWKRVTGDAAADQEKWDGYHTLYGCLRVLSQLIAPFTPFFAETMHQTLRIPDDPISVHLCNYPRPEDIRYSDEALLTEMDMVREIASLGRAGRASATVKEAKKVRQPLARVEIVLARHEHEEWLRRHSDLIAEELNVKAVEFTTEADEYVTYKVVPNFKAIGEKYRALVPKIKAALGALTDAAAARKQLVAEGRLPLTIDGQTVDLTPNEVEIRLDARPGWAAAQGRVGVVVLSTEITPELRDEGLVREFIHHVQAMRKERELAYEARIRLTVEAPPELADLLRRFESAIRSETLATGIDLGAAGAGEAYDVDLEGRAIRIWMALAG